jgi:hypothetical protein
MTDFRRTIDEFRAFLREQTGKVPPPVQQQIWGE